MIDLIRYLANKIECIHSHICTSWNIQPEDTFFAPKGTVVECILQNGR